MNFAVSILVLMELGFEHDLANLIKTGFICFYPCFNGIRVRTKNKGMYCNCKTGRKTPRFIV